jgi:hypothetical protein
VFTTTPRRIFQSTEAKRQHLQGHKCQSPVLLAGQNFHNAYTLTDRLRRWGLRLYEGLKQNSTIVFVPSSAVETKKLGGLTGLTALTVGLGQDRVKNTKELELENNNGDKQLTTA